MVSLNHLRSDRYTSMPLPDSPEFLAACLSLSFIHKILKRLPSTPIIATRDNRTKKPRIGQKDNVLAWRSGCANGSDLTPSYLYEEDAVHFHSTLQRLHAINVDPNSTPRLKNGLVNTLFLVTESQEEKEEYFSTMFEDQVWVDTWRED